MSKRTFIALTVALLFALAVATPALAQDMSHTVEYNLDGTIDLEKTAGHLCNTGAEMKQVISGAGTMTKVSDIYMMEGLLAVEDDNQFIAAATSSLTVTTAIKLCAPAKHIIAATDRAVNAGVVGDVVPVQIGYEYGWDLEYADGEPYFTPLTQQIWAAQVSADPGFSGQLTTNFTAAYGPGPGDGDDEWDWHEDGAPAVTVGEDYVGNYFVIDQFARTSQGTTKRYIDISSPWSHAFLQEDMTVVGRAEVRESFEMMNIAEGAEATTDWWNLF